MGVSLNSALMLYGAGSFLGAVSYLLIMVFQQFLGSAFGKIFFTMNYEEIMINSCYSGIIALVFMFTGHDKFKNILIGLAPGIVYLTVVREGIFNKLTTFDFSYFATYETPLVLVVFALVWGLGMPKLVGGSH